MRIDSRYFNHFMAITAFFFLLAIILASLWYPGKQERRYRERLQSYPPERFVFLDIHGDTLKIASGRPVIVFFWAGWSDRSVSQLNDLLVWHKQNPGPQVVAAWVKDDPEMLADQGVLPGGALSENPDTRGGRFEFVDGTRPYQDLRVPGVPTSLLFDDKGRLMATAVGFRATPVWHQMSMKIKPDDAIRQRQPNGIVKPDVKQPVENR